MKKLLKKHIGLIFCILFSSLFVWGVASWYLSVIDDYGDFVASLFFIPIVAWVVLPALGFIWLFTTTIIDDIINKPYG